MFVIYLHTKHLIPSSYYGCQAEVCKDIFAQMPSCFTLCKNNLEVTYFPKICYHTPFHEPVLSGANVTFMSQVHASGNHVVFTYCRTLRNIKLYRF